MKNKKVFIGVFLVLAVLTLGIGYAAISDITLNINGTASAKPSDDNFKVLFTDDPITVSDAAKVTATKTDDLNATIAVKDLTAKGDKVTATYTMKNDSPDLSASIALPTITNSNEEYFNVTTDWQAAKTVASGDTVTVTVTVELVKTPVADTQEANVNLAFVASPQQP